jgi:hypothetical protein
MKKRILVVRLNVIEPLGVPRAEVDAQLIKSLNEKGMEVLGEIPPDKYAQVRPVVQNLEQEDP